jgi:hypothetical protein
MNNENRKVSDFISEVYRDLPVEMRVRVNTMANELLEIQRKNKALVEDGGEADLREDGENGGIL